MGNYLFSEAPMIHALTEDEILNVLIDYENNTEKYKQIGRAAKQWFNENLGMELAKKYGVLIEYLHKNPEATLANSKEAIEGIFA